MVNLRRRSVPMLLGASAIVLVPWIAWLASSLPCRDLSQHWGLAWAGFDTALATGLALTCAGALRRAPWLDRAAVATATLLATDAWVDVVTSRGAAAVALATTEAAAVELPVALLCLWLVGVIRPRRDEAGRASGEANRRGDGQLNAAA